MYDPPGELMKLGTPGVVPTEEALPLYWYCTPGPLRASMWGESALRLGWFCTCWGTVVVVAGGRPLVGGTAGAGVGGLDVVVTPAVAVLGRVVE
jgi:hypothetical protein